LKSIACLVTDTKKHDAILEKAEVVKRMAEKVEEIRE
jgi:hypothetical protein